MSRNPTCKVTIIILVIPYAAQYLQLISPLLYTNTPYFAVLQYALTLLDYPPHPLQSSLTSLSAGMHFIRQVISVSKKNYLPLTTGRFARIHLIIQRNTTYFPCLSSLSTTTPISHFLLHHSNCIHWILLTAPGRNNSVPSPFTAAFFHLLQAPSRVPKLHCIWLSSSLGPMWYLNGPYTAYGLWFFHSKYPK